MHKIINNTGKINCAVPTIIHLFVFICSLLLLGCHSEHNKTGVEKAMKTYDRLILKKDADSLAGLFLPDGKLGEMATGRDAIKKFLSSFNNVVVLSQNSLTRSIEINGDTATQTGGYTQVDVINNKDTIRVKGDYAIHWQWVKTSGWLISSISTTPAN
ncbi:MAG: nuclear transport factor 2 family protein [Chitinophagaceae bacterium]